MCCSYENNYITRLTHGAWPALPLFTEHVTARGFGTHLDIGGGPTHRPRLSLATPSPLARSDARGRGGGRTRMRGRIHTRTHTRAVANSTNVVLGLRARLGMPCSILCYSQLWDGELLQPGMAANGSVPNPRVRVWSRVQNS